MRKGNVLAVDDNEDILFALDLLLKPHIKKFHSESTPCKVIKLLQEQDFDVILLDMNFSTTSMDGTAGFRLLNRILKTARKTIGLC